jgi:hypothetical protein
MPKTKRKPSMVRVLSSRRCKEWAAEVCCTSRSPSASVDPAHLSRTGGTGVPSAANPLSPRRREIPHPSWIGTSGSRRGMMRSTIYSGSSETRPRKLNAKDATIHFGDGRRWGLRLVCVRGRPRVVTSTGHSSTNPAWLRSFLLCLVFWNTVIWKRGLVSRRAITLAAAE